MSKRKRIRYVPEFQQQMVGLARAGRPPKTNPRPQNV
jgi:hypothetical protein